MKVTMEGPLDHVLRPRLPWRADELTECGRAGIDVAATITADQLRARVREFGQQRTAFTVCATCAGRITGWRDRGETWESNPVAVYARELERTGRWSDLPERLRANRELHAIAALIAAHRTEFDEFMSGLDATVDLATRRRRRTR